MALRAQVVDLIRLDSLDDVHQARGVRQISVVQHNMTTALVRVTVKMINARRIE
jgi:hypothetical protein